MVGAARKLLMVGLSMILGGLLAVLLLVFTCAVIDLVSALASTMNHSGEAKGHSGDSSFGNSAEILIILFGPFAFLFGAIGGSFPVYHFLFRVPIAPNASVGQQLVFSATAFAVVGMAVAIYLESSFMTGIYWGGVLWVLVGAPVIWLRGSVRGT